MPPVTPKTREQIISKVLSARADRAAFVTQMKELQQKGWQVAKIAATVLKKEFGAQRVVLFGSMLDAEHMTWHSDIDLAIWGVSPQDYLKAGIAAEKGHHFSVDLIDILSAPPYILDAVHRGIEL